MRLTIFGTKRKKRESPNDNDGYFGERVAWRGVAWRGVAWRDVAWRGVAWRGVAPDCVATDETTGMIMIGFKQGKKADVFQHWLQIS